MHQGGGKVLIFVRTRNAADDLATLVMQRYGGRSDAIHGQRRQEQRETSLRHGGWKIWGEMMEMDDLSGLSLGMLLGCFGNLMGFNSAI